MQKYIDYNFYIEKYRGNMSATDFYKYGLRAYEEVQQKTFFRPLDSYENEVKKAVCGIADILLYIDNCKSKKTNLIEGKNIKSENVGGKYSVTYDTATSNDFTIEISNQKEEIKSILRQYLLHTGLLYRGV